MGEIMKKLALKLGVFVVGSLLVHGTITAVENKLDGKDILGRPKTGKAAEKTRVSWRGNVILGTDDYTVS